MTSKSLLPRAIHNIYPGIGGRADTEEFPRLLLRVFPPPFFEEAGEKRGKGNREMNKLIKDYDRGKFVMLPKEVISLYGLLPGFNAECMILYGLLRDKANDEGYAWPSRYTLSMETGISERTLDRRLKTLADVGLIEKATRPDGDGNIYLVYDPLPLQKFIKRFPEAEQLSEERAEKIETRRKRDRENKRRRRAAEKE